MNARDYAELIVTSTSLAGKLVPPPALGDPAFEASGPPQRITAPGRPANLPIVPGRQARVPPIAGMRDRQQRARILHALANHELQAIELFAWAVLAFPETPIAFRRGLLAILADEQRHLTLYLARLRAHGVELGEQPDSGHFRNTRDHRTGPNTHKVACAPGRRSDARSGARHEPARQPRLRSALVRRRAARGGPAADQPVRGAVRGLRPASRCR